MSKSLENVEKIIRYKSVAFLSYEEMCEIEKDLERLDKLKKKNKKLKEENEKLKLNLHLMSVERLELLEEIEDWKDKYFNRDGEDY